MSGEFRSQDGAHISAPAKPIRENNIVIVAPTRGGKGAEVVDAHRDNRAGHQGERTSREENGPTYRLSGTFAPGIVDTDETTTVLTPIHQ